MPACARYCLKIVLEILFLFLFLFPAHIDSAPFPNAIEDIRILIDEFKNDPKGPFEGIRWFCPDGSIRPANSPCPMKGGRQHALHKSVSLQIAKDHHIFLGQILSGTDFSAFLDKENAFSRMKQYQLDKYLQAIDDGWILRKARFYRGAYQIEGELKWGDSFLNWLYSDTDLLRSTFFLMRSAARDIPHSDLQNGSRLIRELSTGIANRYPPFSPLRIKLHGQPDLKDSVLVKSFLDSHRSQLSNTIITQFHQLIEELKRVYRPNTVQELQAFIVKLKKVPSIKESLQKVIENESQWTIAQSSGSIAQLLWDIRLTLLTDPADPLRLVLINLSLSLEDILFYKFMEWKPRSVREFFDKFYRVGQAAAGCGYLEIWEWNTLASDFIIPLPFESLTLENFLEKVDAMKRIAEWGSLMVDSTYRDVISQFNRFEPLSTGFSDHKIRSSLLLAMGDIIDKSYLLAEQYGGYRHHILNSVNPYSIRGLNPGMTSGELVVVTGNEQNVSFSSDKIYVLSVPFPSLPPVGGILSISAGNPVSHIQLLARNLGIPNAVISSQTFQFLLPYSGKTLFFAVSPKGNVVMKLKENMTKTEEELLIETHKEERYKQFVPTFKLRLFEKELRSLYTLRSDDSGVICGPKAANLGQLSSFFPEKVAPGFIIPFGIFWDHITQPIPDTSETYWSYLTETFDTAKREAQSGVSSEAIELKVLERLSILRNRIQNMPLKPEFVENLRLAFQIHFKTSIGETLVFVRSDTNMEDLKEFTGAGLNLTVPNVKDEAAILKAIREVWASPYSERSYKWRQRFLLNPEHVYPSILILKSVPSEKSGVMITTGISTQNPKDVTISFNRGIGGAVEGQAAETYLLRANQTETLLSPSRTSLYSQLNPEGGLQKIITSLNIPVLSDKEKQEIRHLADDIHAKTRLFKRYHLYPPYDVEMGFYNDTLWLFQLRPFVENKKSQTSLYLNALDQMRDNFKTIPLD